MHSEAVDLPNLTYSSHISTGNPYANIMIVVVHFCNVLKPNLPTASTPWTNHESDFATTSIMPPEQFRSHSKSPTEFNRTIGRILRKVILIQEVMVCFIVTKMFYLPIVLPPGFRLTSASPPTPFITAPTIAFNTPLHLHHSEMPCQSTPEPPSSMIHIHYYNNYNNMSPKSCSYRSLNLDSL